MARFANDTSGQPYVEIDSSPDERLRLTLIAEASYSGRPAVRIQVRDAKGHLRQGPEIPLTSLDQVSQAFGWAKLYLGED